MIDSVPILLRVIEERINNQTKIIVNAIEKNGTKEVLSKREAAAFLDIDPDTIGKLMRQNAITFYKPGATKNGKPYFKREDLIQYALKNPVRSKIELERIALKK